MRRSHGGEADWPPGAGRRRSSSREHPLRRSGFRRWRRRHGRRRCRSRRHGSAHRPPGPPGGRRPLVPRSDRIWRSRYRARPGRSCRRAARLRGGRRRVPAGRALRGPRGRVLVGRSDDVGAEDGDDPSSAIARLGVGVRAGIVRELDRNSEAATRGQRSPLRSRRLLGQDRPLELGELGAWDRDRARRPGSAGRPGRPRAPRPAGRRHRGRA